jgi:hypothetical protein
MKSKGYRDPVMDLYMRDVDRKLLRENLKLTPARWLEKVVSLSSFAASLRQAGRGSRCSKKALSAARQFGIALCSRSRGPNVSGTIS